MFSRPATSVVGFFSYQRFQITNRLNWDKPLGHQVVGDKCFVEPQNSDPPGLAIVYNKAVFCGRSEAWVFQFLVRFADELSLTSMSR